MKIKYFHESPITATLYHCVALSNNCVNVHEWFYTSFFNKYLPSTDNNYLGIIKKKKKKIVQNSM